MSNTLPLKKLGEVCGFVRGPFGGSLKKSCFKLEGNAVYEQQHAIYDQFNKIRYFIDDDKFQEMKRFELLPGNLIMSCSGTMGKVAIVPRNIKKGIINQALLKLSPTNKLDVEYLKYWMTSNGFQESLAKHTVGAAIKNVASVKILKEIEIPCPEISEQEQIVSILDKAFAAIDQAKANTESNLQNAKDFLQSLFNQIFIEKNEGWEIMIIEDVCEKIFAGGDVPKDNFSTYKTDKFEIPIFSNGIKNRGLYGYTDIKKVLKPSITVSARGTIGYSEIRESPFFPIIRLIVLTPKTEIISLPFLKYVISSINFINSGSSIPQLTVPMIKKYKLSLPPIIEQQQIVQKFDKLSFENQKLQEKYQQKLFNLEKLKKSLLQKAFSGELT